ncbi:hypothetical protein QJS66_12735 [Kocuria rhizophila]|nr:hypothetical protein QJS66_12735 [Kocuria rhizophila]
MPMIGGRRPSRSCPRGSRATGPPARAGPCPRTRSAGGCPWRPR